MRHIQRAVNRAHRWTSCYWRAEFGTASAAAIPVYLLALVEQDASVTDRVISSLVSSSRSQNEAAEIDWCEALWYAISVREAARQASAYGHYALEMLRLNCFEEALSALRQAESIERKYTTEPVYWSQAVLSLVRHTSVPRTHRERAAMRRGLLPEL